MTTELLKQIDGYADGKISREHFELWFYDLSFDVEKKQPHRIVTSVHEVEGLLAEASSGGWNEDDLRRELSLAVAPYRRVLAA